jgi:hypothetical protein
MGVLDKAKAAVQGLADMAGNLLGAGVDKIKGAIDEVIAGSAELQHVGYRLTDVELRLALSPSVIFHLVREREAIAEAFEAVLANNKKNRTLCTVVKLLRQVNAVQRRVQPKDRQFRSLEIELGLPPVVRMKYTEVTPSPRVDVLEIEGSQTA